jgi:hypothetical protein
MKTMRTECAVYYGPEGLQYPQSLCVRILFAGTSIMRLTFFVFLLFTFHASLFTSAEAEILDRVVAFVSDQAITLSELQEQYGNSKKLTPDITEEEVLNTMINRLVLLSEAKKYSIEAPSTEEILNEYIDLKVRAFIRVSEKDIEAFYTDHKDKFIGKEFEDVREEIEKYFTEKELNTRLKELLKELRKNAYIKIQLKPDI